MNSIIHRASTRGIANFGWLKSRHTFSFGNYYDPDRMGFGKLRVINDDIVSPSQGFGTHPHENMEIISIPISGSLKHKDTMGNDFVIGSEEIQVMSAGTGIAHSEYNNSKSEDVHFLQIWVLPLHNNIEPQYDQKRFDLNERKNKIQLIVSPDGRENSVRINQNAFFSLVDLEKSKTITYEKKNLEHGVYVFMIDGDINVNLANENISLQSRDGLGVVSTDDLSFNASEYSKILIIEVPL